MVIGKLRFLFFFIVFLGYSQALVEVNTDTIKNTWGDEYDTYVHSRTSESQNVNANEHHTDLELTFVAENIQVSPLVNSLPTFSNSEVNLHPFKIFLKNCSLLI